MNMAPFFFDASVSKVQATACDFRFTAISLPVCDPMYSMSPAIAGEENIGQCLKSRENNSAPVPASSARNRPESEVAKYTFPFFTTGDAMTHDPLLLNAHFFCPVCAFTAYRFESRQPKYTTPSAITGED